MKKLLIVLAALAVLALPGVAFAQCSGNDVCIGSTNTYSPTADEISAQNYKRDQSNTANCTGVGLPASCTQAEFDAVIPTPPAAVIYLNNAQGVRDYFMAKLKLDIAATVSTQQAEHKSRARTAWADASEAERDAACVALGKAADCT